MKTKTNIIKKQAEITIKISSEYKEFLNITSELQKSEWINGKLVLHSPVMNIHNATNIKLTSLINSHVNRNNLGLVLAEKALINFEFAVHNYEPDIVYYIPEKAEYINDDTSLYSIIPDFVVEILSKSTKKNDRGIKFQTYQKHGVREYWIIEPVKQIIEQYLLINNKYQEPIIYELGDTIESKIIKNFEIRLEALFERIYYLAALDRPVSAKYKPIIKEKNDKIALQQEQLIQKENKLEHNKKELEHNKKELEHNKKELEHNKKELKHNKNTIKNSIKGMIETGMSIKQIQEITNLSKEQIEKFQT